MAIAVFDTLTAAIDKLRIDLTAAIDKLRAESSVNNNKLRAELCRAMWGMGCGIILVIGALIAFAPAIQKLFS